jgi:glycosyltransferase involved in cell wall biosynthesis
MKIAVVVHGRFHGFDLARALLRRGHNLTLFTNYPGWAVRQFGFPAKRVRSFWLHGIASKGAYRLHDAINGIAWKGASRLPDAIRGTPEPWLNPVFGSWAAKELSRERWDVIHAWSGISEEIYKSGSKSQLNLIMRGSAHIRTQERILREEERRTGARLALPGRWIREREEREYRLADRIVVLSSFAYDSFIAEGLEPARLRLLPLGASTTMFRAPPEVIEARCRRILSGQPLRVLYVGALSLRKGLWDAKSIVEQLGTQRFHFRFIGPAAPETRGPLGGLRALAELVPRQPQKKLPGWYADSDLFIFPTLEDGFAVVLAQAHANALPILTTPNCTGPDLIENGRTGWILPIRSPGAFIERLQWCDANRPLVADMVRRLHSSQRVRDWDDVAGDFEAMCIADLAAGAGRSAARG